MHGRRTSSEEDRQARRCRQARKDSAAYRQRKRRNVVRFKVDLPRRMVDQINADLKLVKAAPADPEPALSTSEWDDWFGRHVLVGVIAWALKQRKNNRQT